MTTTVHIISKYLWASILMLCAMLVAAWWALSQTDTQLPSKILQQMSAQISSITPTLTAPKISPPTFSNPIPQTLTYYRWTDENGDVGYSKELPEKISSFKAIVLNGSENTLQN